MPEMEKQYMNLKASGKSMDAQMLLDAFSMQRWEEAIELAESTLESMTKLTVESSAWGRQADWQRRAAMKRVSIKFVHKAAALH